MTSRFGATAPHHTVIRLGILLLLLGSAAGAQPSSPENSDLVDSCVRENGERMVRSRIAVRSWYASDGDYSIDGVRRNARVVLNIRNTFITCRWLVAFGTPPFSERMEEDPKDITAVMDTFFSDGTTRTMAVGMHRVFSPESRSWRVLDADLRELVQRLTFDDAPDVDAARPTEH